MKHLDYNQIASLVTKVQAGDNEAFAELYILTYESQYILANQIMTDTYLAEDIIQDVYIRLFKTIHDLRVPKTLLSYLNRMTYNACISYKRQLYYRAENAVEHDYLDSFQDNHNTFPTPEGQLLAMEKADAIQCALNRLSDRDRTIFLLRYYQDMKLNTIATTLDCSVSTVKRRLKVCNQVLGDFVSKHKMPGFIFTPVITGILKPWAAEILSTSSCAKTFEKIILSTVDVHDSRSCLYPNALKNLNSTPTIKLKSFIPIALICTIAAMMIFPIGNTLITPSLLKTTVSSDQDVPTLIAYTINGDTLNLTLKDTLSGINYSNIYGLTNEGTRLTPSNIDTENNQVSFFITGSNLTLYIEDNEGNQGISTVTVNAVTSEIN